MLAGMRVGFSVHLVATARRKTRLKGRRVRKSLKTWFGSLQSAVVATPLLHSLLTVQGCFPDTEAELASCDRHIGLAKHGIFTLWPWTENVADLP